MFGLKKKRPPGEFTHTYDCKIVQSDPGVEIPWSYVGDGLWEAVCVCTKEFYRDPEMDERARLDPLDPKTSQHAGQCEFAGVTDAAVVRLALRVTDKDGYAWVECASCEHGWQVPHFAEPSR